MLPEKPWRAEAVVRLIVSVLICTVFLGGAAVYAVEWFEQDAAARNPRVLIGLAGATVCFAFALILLARSWPAQNFPWRALGLFVSVDAGLALIAWVAHLKSSAGEVGGSPLRLVAATLSFQGAALILVRHFLREHGTRWAEAFGFWRNWKRAVWSGLLTAVGVFLLTLVLLTGIQRLMQRFGIEPREQIAVQVAREAGTWIDRLLLAIATIVIAPPAEEMLFRGIAYPVIKQRGHPRLALWGTSLFFAAIHLNLAIFVPLTLLAVILVRLYERTGNLLAPITAHVGFNALNFAMLHPPLWLEKALPWFFSR